MWVGKLQYNYVQKHQTQSVGGWESYNYLQQHQTHSVGRWESYNYV